MVKVHLFYYDEYIYAFTATKKIAKKFMAQRCMKTVIHRTEKMTDGQWAIFCKKHNSLLLIENPFDTKSGCIQLVTTYGEDEEISRFIASLEDSKEECINHTLERIGFKKKIDTMLREGLGMIYTNIHDGGITINLDALAIAIYLFEPTFTGEGEIRALRTVDFNLN